MKQSIRWFLNLYDGGQLDLDPSYQRRSVWTLKDRKYFLDTIFRNYPSPAVFIHKELDRESVKMQYHVIDGKQRLETIFLFAHDHIAIDRDYGDTRLNGKKWSGIENEPDLKEHFYNYVVPVEFIGTDDSIVINEVFERLNRTSRKLERQELRHAKYDGWFIRTAEAEAEKDEWERLGVVTKSRMRRMKDVQCISEILIVFLKNRVLGYDQDRLDDIYAEYDSPHETLPDFQEEDFRKDLAFTKDYILRMEAHNAAITNHAKGFGNFYSLWAFVALNRKSADLPEKTAERYSAFMEKVTALSKADNMEKLLQESEQSHYQDAYQYLKSSARTGAAQMQREARNSILAKVLLGRPAQQEPVMTENAESRPRIQDIWSLVRNDGGNHVLKLAMGKSNNIREKDPGRG
ncbi:MAG: DUF262 domain-containing protein [Nitrospirota bacterium]